jgi:hypothetical protein
MPTQARFRTLIAASVLLVVIAACGLEQPAPIVIPPGAQVVRVFADDESVRLVPASVRAGDVYFVLEGPNPAISFISRAEQGGEPEGMDEAQVQRVAQGDLQNTSTDGFSVTCEREWNPEERWTGCRENALFVLGPGFYALSASNEDPGVAPVMAVLEVTP